MRTWYAIAIVFFVVPANAQRRDASAAMTEAATHVAMFRYEDGAARFETIARDSS